MTMTRFRRILCATDFSKTSGKALTCAIHVAKANRARLMILYAYVPIVPLVPEQHIDSRTWDRVDTETRRWVEGQLARLADKVRKAGVRASAMIVMGDPAQHIVRIARSKRVDLIVVGTHGRRGFSSSSLAASPSG